MAGDDGGNIRNSKHVRLELQRDDNRTNTYRVSIQLNQYIRMLSMSFHPVWLTGTTGTDAYVTSTGNKHDVLDAGISSDRLDNILSTCRRELAAHLKREWAKANSMCPPHCGG
jgi:hypothetical protein